MLQVSFAPQAFLGRCCSLLGASLWTHLYVFPQTSAMGNKISWARAEECCLAQVGRKKSKHHKTQSVGSVRNGDGDTLLSSNLAVLSSTMVSLPLSFFICSAHAQARPQVSLSLTLLERTKLEIQAPSPQGKRSLDLDALSAKFCLYVPDCKVTREGGRCQARSIAHLTC